MVWTHLVNPGLLTPHQAVAALSIRPARIAGLVGHGHPVAAGNPANLCVLDPAEQWVVDPVTMASRSQNNPFAGDTLTGRVQMTIRRGEVTFSLRQA